MRNKVILVGNLGQEPEVRYSADGTCICNVSLATSEKWKDKTTGEQVERTEWHKLVFFKQLAEVVGKHLTKGSKVYVEGSNRTKKWTDKGGVDHWTTSVVCNEMTMLGGGNAAPPATGGGQFEPRNQAVQPEQAGGNDWDEDIPF